MSGPKPRLIALCLAMAAAVCLPHTARAAGTVTNADESDLVAAMSGGGLVTLACDGVIGLTNTLEISNNLILDGTGHQIAISGLSSVEIFTIDNNVSLAMTNVTLANGLNQAFAHNTGPPFNFNIIEGGLGGAVDNGGTLLAVNCAFTNCAALGLDGSVDFNGNQNDGSDGLGGAIYNLGALVLSNCVIAGNRAEGGTGIPGFTQTYVYEPGDGYEGGGGGVYNVGSATIVNCIFSNNAADGGAGGPIQNNDSIGQAFTVGGAGGVGNGGGFCNANVATILASTFVTNSATGGDGGNGGPGDNPFAFMGAVTAGGPGGDATNGTGAALCDEMGSLVVVNCTLATNNAGGGNGGPGGNGTDAEYESPPTAGGNGGNGGDGGGGFGGGIGIIFGTVSATNLTLVGNTVTNGEGGAGGGGGFGSGASDGANGLNGSPGAGGGQSIANPGGSLVLLNTILDCTTNAANGYGSVDDAGYNLSSDSTGFLTNSTSLNGINPELGQLRNNGGPTPTCALLAGSPAIDAADPMAFPAADQRGFPRPFGAEPDIGAFEFGTVIWTNPGPITYGAALTTNQLNAAAIISGSFTYTPGLGTYLTAGTNALSVVFTPADTNDFNSLTDTVSIAVLPAPLVVVASNAFRLAGNTNPIFTGSMTGVTNGDNITAAFGSAATSNSPPGDYAITPVLIDPSDRETNYTVTLAGGVLAVGQVPYILAPPQSQSTTTGGNTTFVIDATSSPLPVVNSGTLQLWLKADAGVVTNGSGDVSLWRDQSGNSNDASQSSSALQPSLASASGLGGAAAVRFNGIQDNVHGSFMSGANATGLSNAMTAFTIYSAFSCVNATNILWDIGVPGTAGADRVNLIESSDSAFSFWGANDTVPFLLPTNTYRLETERLDTNMDTLEIFDAAPVSDTNFTISVSGATNPGAGYYVGGIDPSIPGAGGSRCFDGDIAELLFYRGALTDTDRLAVSGYLQEKYFQGAAGQLGYQWRVNGNNIAGGTGPSFPVTNAYPTDGGTYDVDITNGYGGVFSSGALLTVNYIIATGKNLPLQFATTNLTLPSHVQPGDAFNVSAVDAISQRGGAEQLTNSAITYSPSNGFTGIDVFNYVLTPTSGRPITNTITVLVDDCAAVSDVETNGVATVQFVSAIPNVTYKVEASADLRSWTIIGSATAGPGGTFQFVDPQAGLFSHRFYRSALP